MTRQASRGHTRTLRALLSPLEERQFRLLFVGRTISLFGTVLGPIAVAFAVAELTGNASDFGLVLAAGFVPQLLFLLAGGIWADRLPRHVVMIVSDVVMGGAQAALAVLLLTGRAEIWHLVALAALKGTAAAFFVPASTAIVPDVIRPHHLQQANALLGLSKNFTRIGGAATAGILVATVGPGWTLAIDGATAAVGAVFLALLSAPRPSKAPRRHFVGELVEGWNEFRSRTWLWAMVLQFAFLNAFATGAFVVLGPFVAAESLGGASAWGVIIACQAAGMVGGGLVSLRYRPERPLLAAASATLLLALPLGLLAVTAPVAAIAAGAFLAGFGLEFFIVIWDTTLQQEIPREKLSRVSSYDFLGSFALTPVATAAVGPIAMAVGTARTLWGAAAVVVVATSIVLAVGDVRRLRRRVPSRPRPQARPVPRLLQPADVSVK